MTLGHYIPGVLTTEDTTMDFVLPLVKGDVGEIVYNLWGRGTSNNGTYSTSGAYFAGGADSTSGACSNNGADFQKHLGTGHA